jgi:hypothetical protein
MLSDDIDLMIFMRLPPITVRKVYRGEYNRVWQSPPIS